MTAPAILQPDPTMRRISYTVPFFVTISKASLLASLITNPTAEIPMSPASGLDECFEAAFGDATISMLTPRDLPAVSLVESLTSDLHPGDSFTDADAAALGFRLAQRRAALPISEADFGSDL